MHPGSCWGKGPGPAQAAQIGGSACDDSPGASLALGNLLKGQVEKRPFCLQLPLPSAPQSSGATRAATPAQHTQHAKRAQHGARTAGWRAQRSSCAPRGGCPPGSAPSPAGMHPLHPVSKSAEQGPTCSRCLHPPCASSCSRTRCFCLLWRRSASARTLPPPLSGRRQQGARSSMMPLAPIV